MQFLDVARDRQSDFRNHDYRSLSREFSRRVFSRWHPAQSACPFFRADFNPPRDNGTM